MNWRDLALVLAVLGAVYAIGVIQKYLGVKQPVVYVDPRRGVE